MVRWLLFDVGGVLERVDDATWPTWFTERCAARVGLPADELSARLDAADLPDTTVRTGVDAEYWSALAAAIGADDTALAAIRSDFWDAYCGSANTLLLDEARALRGRVGLAILSNSVDGAREEEERRYGFAALFDPICYSHELGVRKPDPLAFSLTLAAMGADPAEVLFVDDVPANVAAAEALGIRAHRHVDDAGTLAVIRAAVQDSGHPRARDVASGP